ncbi:MAG TPA: MoaD/ThiS family protein [Planctomycetota bacterium]|nr:MoaD/ThiS family protein [Planctomycetota bacterium]
MPVSVRISSAIAHLTRGTTEVSLDAQEATTVDAALLVLDARFPGLRSRLCDGEGRIKLFVRLFVGEEDIRLLPEGQATRLKDGDHLDIQPAIAGG